MFPLNKYDLNKISHDPISIPACSECLIILEKFECLTTDCLRDEVKSNLTKKYQKDLSIGSNWTEEELQESDFTGVAFEGFKKSAWNMYKIAKSRVNFKGWPISINGIDIDYSNDTAGFEFDGILFSNLEAAIKHFVKTFIIDEALLRQSVEVLGEDKFNQAIKYSRLHPNISASEREKLIQDLEFSITEEKNASQEKLSQVNIEGVEEVSRDGVCVDTVTVAWALDNDVQCLSDLYNLEDDFFDYFYEKNSEKEVWSKFNALEFYLEKYQL
ncbi:hypothetical protein Q4591_18700 [Shewanella sp. 3_MG-2023]|uniref:hypothetical protein n=1 Tax=Shewanella sp. 3_MG-2023 TaxID=3062635 RepID=UPI0026E1CEE0|nr:hypothetical protein [Shewanella sp. 3_MG-2023]MDO6777373.1 hypothetical protein [Shewanella sp. 3_MG-2023]